jgi:hypothetical protein
VAKKRAPGKTVAEILRLAETPSILDADKPPPDLFERTRLHEVLEQSKATSERLESPALQDWVENGLAECERVFQDEMTRLAARAEFEARQQPAPQVATAGLAPVPVQRQAAQAAAVLDAIRSMGHDPLALPKWKPSKPGVKAAVRAALNNTPLFHGTVFDKTWDRLRAGKEIADKP